MRDITQESDTEWRDLIGNWVVINEGTAVERGIFVQEVDEEDDGTWLYGRDADGQWISVITSSIRSLSS